MIEFFAGVIAAIVAAMISFFVRGIWQDSRHLIIKEAQRDMVDRSDWHLSNRRVSELEERVQQLESKK